jgi:hypothetical protein
MKKGTRFVGLDVHKDTIAVAVAEVDGEVRSVGTIPNEEDAALVTDPQQVRRFLRGIGEPTEPPPREPARGPPFWKSRVLRRAGHDEHVA